MNKEKRKIRISLISENETDEQDNSSTSYHIQNQEQLEFWIRKFSNSVFFMIQKMKKNYENVAQKHNELILWSGNIPLIKLSCDPSTVYSLPRILQYQIKVPHSFDSYVPGQRQLIYSQLIHRGLFFMISQQYHVVLGPQWF
jgi:hypothetical protein